MLTQRREHDEIEGENLNETTTSKALGGANIYSCVSDLVGNTPLLSLNRLAKKHACVGQLVAKLEFMNPMSSTKDRPALAMLKQLMSSSHFCAQTHIIEATSGNNGVSCAWLCALHGIKLTIVIPEHMSIERRKMIQHFGANVVLTPKHLGTKGAIDHAKELVKATPYAVSLDQFGNLANPEIHARTTAQEIIRDCGENIDVFIAGVGTGGSLTGIASVLKQVSPHTQIVAVEPARCPVLSSGRSGVHGIQGLSSGHVPDILKRELIDRIETVEDEDAITYARALARTAEGLAVGISSGATACAAVRIAQQAEYADKRIVMILADTAERYYSTALFEQETHA
ncbi:cysteine synthase A [Alteromonas oceanisediminis]|uniref:cysteine synthase A n=1 Tax=Alteromonas oceanisediminis TaxID=2836180 RepID=UPI001BDA35B5|nr:cysteine synthase A [Alteromonas oceanisediminis]MBT0587094.1 cysteine synthase A [Alteromonas oceanisediminis]